MYYHLPIHDMEIFISRRRKKNEIPKKKKTSLSYLYEVIHVLIKLTILIIILINFIIIAVINCN